MKSIDFKSPSFDLLADLGETAIDELLSNDVIKDIPILGTAINLARTVIGLRERAFLNKLRLFVQSLPHQSDDERSKLCSAIANDCDSRDKVGEAIFSTLEQADSTVKVQYIGLVFAAFLREYISDRELRELCYSIRITQVDDLVEFIESESPRERLLREMVHTGLVGVRYPPVPVTHSGTLEVKPIFGLTKNGYILRNVVQEAMIG